MKSNAGRIKIEQISRNVRVRPGVGIRDALIKIGSVCKTYSPHIPFLYKFADEQYAAKFKEEERIGKLAGISNDAIMIARPPARSRAILFRRHAVLVEQLRLFLWP